MHQVRLTFPAGSRLPFHPREIHRLLMCMLQSLTLKSAEHAKQQGDALYAAWEVELVFVRDAEIATLNRQYLDCLGPTNCLAFPDAGRPGAFPRGSLFVSLDTLYRECMLYGQAPAAYLRRLLAHGLVHLAGFEHGKEMEALCAQLEECRQELG